MKTLHLLTAMTAACAATAPAVRSARAQTPAQAPAAVAAPSRAAAAAPTPAPSPAVAPMPMPAQQPAPRPSPRAATTPAEAMWLAPGAPAPAVFSQSGAWSSTTSEGPQDPQGGWIGIGISCEQCSRSGSTSSRAAWTFRALPMVMWVDAEGPAYRAGMRSGDTLLSVDGFDITSAEGGRAFARIQPGQRVTLAYRREGRERRVQITAILRPERRNDAEARAMMERYQLLQDSQLRGALAQMAAAAREMERVQQELASGNRAAIEESRRRLLAADSALRALQGAETGRSRSWATTFPPGYFGAVAPTPPVPPVPSVSATPMSLRYSGRIGDLVNVEARAAGAVNTTEIGDSVIVVTAGDVVVRVTRRAGVSGFALVPGAVALSRTLASGIVLTDEGDAVIGVTGTVLRNEQAAPFGVGTAYQVRRVSAGSHADSLGLQANDVILDVNGHSVTRGSSRVNVSGAASVTVMRGGERRRLALSARR